MDLAESAALGYGYKSKPTASGLGAHPHSSYFLSAWRDFITASLLGDRPRWQQSGDREIKDYKNTAKAGEEEPEGPKQGQLGGQEHGRWE